MTTMTSAPDTLSRHWPSGGLSPLATKYSCISGRNRALIAASRAAARHGLRSSTVEDIKTTGTSLFRLALLKGTSRQTQPVTWQSQFCFSPGDYTPQGDETWRLR